MNGLPNETIAQLRGPVLRSVSRSFYLSIRLLPAKLRDPIALAYLLARATDTIADTAEISASLRREQLARLAQLIQSNASTGAADGFANFARQQRDDSERVLIGAIPACLAWLQALPPADQQDIRKVLRAINEGQALDVERFPGGKQIAALQTAAELDQYTYLVAGCVGEFWTTTCFRHLPKFSRVDEPTMLSWGIAYGKGLQLVNILRDAGADLRAGRCYLPADELSLLGLSPGELLRTPDRVISVTRAWRERAEQGIADGIEYACAIRPARVRLATVLPALIGARTLALLRDAGDKAFVKKVKVPRREVRQIMLKMISSFASPRSIRSMFTRLSS